ncbi:MAG: VWA domain-containing protein [Acidobacteriia bacterium]|nr:VWA domain-containing protein [Terriglobia bacterium]
MVMAWPKSSPAIQRSRMTLGLLAFVRSGTLLRFLFAVIVTLAASSYAAAQVGISEVHVLPRAMPASPAPTRQTVRANVDLVLVNVTVLDHADRAVTGLEPANFAVLDNKSPQIVRYLSNVDEPISLVVVLDASASMAAKIQEARKALTELINTSNPQDDFALIVIHDQPRVALHFDDPLSEIQGTVDALQPDGFTALWDSMYLGITELENSHYQRKAMVVLSDGGDNHSRYTESDIKSLLEEAGVEVYAIGMFDRFASRPEEKIGPLQLDEVTSITGGRVFSAHDSSELSRAVTRISHELRNQYVLGYYPSNRSRDGKWRRLKVHLTGSASQTKFRLYAKKGYYAPTE